MLHRIVLAKPCPGGCHNHIIEPSDRIIVCPVLVRLNLKTPSGAVINGHHIVNIINSSIKWASSAGDGRMKFITSKLTTTTTTSALL